MPKSSESGRPGKPAKPSKDFPLTPHNTGRWCKKIRGQLYYFGTWGDPDGALEEYLRQKDYLLAGRTPPECTGSITVRDLCDWFLSAKEDRKDAGELAPRSFERYRKACKRIKRVLGSNTPAEGLTPDEFANLRRSLARKHGTIALGVEIQMVRTVFKWGYDAGKLDRPVRFGPDFRKPSAKNIRAARHAKGPRLFSPTEIKALLAVATPNMRAMILLGINGALGPTDLAYLPKKAVDLDDGWIDYPRPKTEVERRIPLWPETVEAISAALAQPRHPRAPRDHCLVFIGKRGQNYTGKNRGYRVNQEYARACKRAGIAGRKFYDLRRTFQTIAEGCRDLPAVQYIMGHAHGSADMSAIYRQLVDDDRLLAAANHVRRWLYPPENSEEKDATPKASD